MEAANERVRDLVRRHGWNATATQTLAEGYSYFFHDDACVAYVDTGAAWVAAGAPIAAPEHLDEVTRAFLAAAEHADRRCCFFATERRFAELAPEATRSIHVGNQPVWDPSGWSATLAQHAGLREQLRRARAKHVTIREVAPEELRRLGAPIDTLVERWHATRQMPPMSFLVKWRALGDDRAFIAEQKGAIVAFARVVPVPQRDGWFIEHLIRAPDAPNGTVELLVDGVLRRAQELGIGWLTLGLAPLAGELPPMLRAARRLTPWLYDFEGLRRFKSRLRPSAWDPIFVARPPRQSTLLTVLDVLAAFTPHGLVRFAARALARGPAIVVAGLAALLVVWTLLLASASSAQWFAGHALVKWAWVAYDALIVGGLVQLVRRPDVTLASMLFVLVALDGIATPVEAFAWNVHRVHGALDALIVVAACLAPPFAALVLRGARARLAAEAGSRSARDRPRPTP